MAIFPVRREGSKVVPETPVPLQEPPLLPVTYVAKLTVPFDAHKVPGLVHAADTDAATEILCVTEAVHEPLVTE